MIASMQWKYIYFLYWVNWRLNANYGTVFYLQTHGELNKGDVDEDIQLIWVNKKRHDVTVNLLSCINNGFETSMKVQQTYQSIDSGQSVAFASFGSCPCGEFIFNAF